MTKSNTTKSNTKSNTTKSNTKSNTRGVPKCEAKFFIGSHANAIRFSAKRPGVISHIVWKLLVDEQHAVSKDELLDSLCETFPERERAKMKSTLMMQVPSGLYAEKRVVVRATVRDDKRCYYIDVPATAQAQDDWARQARQKEAKRAAAAK